MKRNVLTVLVGIIFLACVTAFGQTETKVGKKPSEVLEKILAGIEKGKVPAEIYPPGMLEGLAKKADNGDEPMAFQEETFKSSKSKGDGMAMQRLFNPLTQRFQVIDLGTLNSAPYSLEVNDMNESGEFVGSYITNNTTRAFKYSSGTFQSIGPNNSVANGINNLGQIVGSYETVNLDYIAFRYSNGIMQNLGSGLNTYYSTGDAINDNGQIAGSYFTNGEYHVFRYLNGNIKDFGNIGGGYINLVSDINEVGNITGSLFYAGTNGSITSAFLCSGSIMEYIEPLTDHYSDAFGVNNDNQIIGYYRALADGYSIPHAFLSHEGHWEDIATLGGSWSLAYDINNHGQIVGAAAIGNGSSRALLYQNGMPYNLNNLIATNLISMQGWVLQEARAINDKGQIVSTGVKLGQTHIFLLNPLPEGWEVITNQPVQPVYGDCPAKGLGKDSLIVVTHGWNPDLSWVRAMTNSIGQYLTNNNLTNWQVAGYEWASNASTGFLPSDAQEALENARREGIKIGNPLVLQEWSHIHFIGHSAGAGLIQAATEVIKTNSSSTTVHCTFLDAYVGKHYEGIQSYGSQADWSDSYFSRDAGTRFGSLMTGPFTESLLDHAYNVDVTPLDPSKIIGAKFRSSVTGELEPCIKTFTSHDWPVDFYVNTITGNTNSDYEGFGFALSKEGGNWNYALANYTPSNAPARILGTPDPTCTTEIQVTAPVWVDKLIDFIQSPSITNTTGTILKTNNSFDAFSGSPAWLATFVSSTNPANVVSFDVQFTSTNGAQGLLSVYWDDQVIGSVDERVVSSGNYKFSFPNATANTTHMLGFRLDPFTNIQSSVTVTNVMLKQVGVSQPFSLSVVTNSSNGLVYQLTGEAGFEYTVQASTNLVDWTEIATLANTNGIVRFFDQTATNAPMKFYRGVAPY